MPSDATGGDALAHLLHRRTRIVRAVRTACLDELTAGVLGAARRGGEVVAQPLDLVRSTAQPAERLRVLRDLVFELLGPLGADATGDLVPAHRRRPVCGDRVFEPLLRAGIEHRVEPPQLELEVARRVDLREGLRRGLLGDADPTVREQERDRECRRA